MTPQRERFTLLGPHVGGQSYSIVKYFSFLRSNLSSYLGAQVFARWPGREEPSDGEPIPQLPRPQFWLENYVQWPARLPSLDSDLFHIVDQGLLWYNRFLRKGRRIATVHDLIAFMTCVGRLPYTPPPLKRRLLIRENMSQLARMDRIIAVSEFTAGILVREAGVKSSAISVVPNHVGPEFTPLSDEERIRARETWFGGSEYAIIHVGKASVYKNRIGAMRAFELLVNECPSARLYLVHGAPDGEEQEFLRNSRVRNSVRFLRPLNLAELREFYGAADLLVFPSRYEGFGWPPLEAMACGCPVVSTTCASLREVVGDAALTLDDPDDHSAIAALMKSVLINPGTAGALRERGFRQAAKFAPPGILSRMAQIYRELA